MKDLFIALTVSLGITLVVAILAKVVFNYNVNTDILMAINFTISYVDRRLQGD